MNNFYSGEKLLNTLDMNGKRPEIYIVESNRSAGKTTYFAKKLIDNFLNKNEKFIIIYRWAYEIKNCADSFFGSVNSLFYPASQMTQRTVEGKYAEMILDDKLCGYGIALNSANYIKRRSNAFNDVTSIFFDEIQPEDNLYCPNEIDKFISIHTSIARGGGQQVRYVPVYMCSNSVSLLNPYYSALGISERLQRNTKILRGDGFVLERNFNQAASNAQKTSGFNRAFAKSEYVSYSAESVYLNDNNSFIGKPQGKSRYICTVRYKNNEYAVRLYGDILYCDTSIDKSCKLKITAQTADHIPDFVLASAQSVIIQRMRDSFAVGNFRFKNLDCKTAILHTLSF